MFHINLSCTLPIFSALKYICSHKNAYQYNVTKSYLNFFPDKKQKSRSLWVLSYCCFKMQPWTVPLPPSKQSVCWGRPLLTEQIKTIQNSLIHCPHTTALWNCVWHKQLKSELAEDPNYALRPAQLNAALCSAGAEEHLIWQQLAGSTCRG